MGRWFNDKVKEWASKLQYAVARMWHIESGKNRAAWLASAGDWRNGAEACARLVLRERVRRCVSRPRNIRAGGQDDGRRDVLGNRAVTRATQPHTRPRISSPRESTHSPPPYPLFLHSSFIHSSLSISPLSSSSFSLLSFCFFIFPRFSHIFHFLGSVSLLSLFLTVEGWFG